MEIVIVRTYQSKVRDTYQVVIPPTA